MFRTPYDGKRVRVAIDFTGQVSMAKQAFKEECDINNIIKRHNATGLLTHVNKMQAVFADVSDMPDYRTSLERVKAAQDAFASLPSSIRKRCNNDPGMFLEFVSDTANEAELRKLGILVPKKEEAPASSQPALDKQPPKPDDGKA